MRKFILYFILFFQIMLIVSLVKGVYNTFQSRDRITKLQERKVDLENKKDELIQKMEEVQSPLYLEKVAREELHLSKPGETVVIVPTNQQMPPTPPVEEEHGGELSNWKKWWDVLSGTQ